MFPAARRRFTSVLLSQLDYYDLGLFEQIPVFPADTYQLTGTICRNPTGHSEKTFKMLQMRRDICRLSTCGSVFVVESYVMHAITSTRPQRALHQRHNNISQFISSKKICVSLPSPLLPPRPPPLSQAPLSCSAACA